jgi:hypothetical protein
MFEFHPKVKSSTKTSAIRYETPFQVEHVSKRSMMLSKAFSYIFLKYSFRSGSDPDLYAGILIDDWDQPFALDITQKSSVFCLFHFVVFVSVSKLFKNENLQSYIITKINQQ